ncbi:pilin [Candidatus Gracilibacteria bacterium]|nr:pilin [Candidatus Gracilibacteria bacterium]
MKKLSLVFVVLFYLLIGGGICEAQTKTSDLFGKNEVTNDLAKNTNLVDYTYKVERDKDSTSWSSQNEGENQFKSVVKAVIFYLNKLFISIAIVFTVWSGMNLILARGDEEEFSKRLRHIYGLAIGFIILALAPIIIDKIFFGAEGEVFLNEENVTAFAKEGVLELRGIFKYFVSFGVVAGVAYIIFSAVKMLIAGGEDESQISKLKRRMVFVVMGIATLISADKIISLFTGKEGKLAVPDVNKSVEFFVEWANFMLGLIGVIAVFTLIYGGIRLIANFGQDEQGVEDAKKVIIASVIGLVVAFSAWTIMYAFLVH